MEARCCFVLFLILLPIVLGAWKTSREDRIPRDHRRGIHYHSKRHMMSSKPEVKKRVTTTKPRETRKKITGHVAPLEDDEMDNDEVISVAIGPPPVRPKYDKVNWKHNIIKQTNVTKPKNVKPNDENFNNNAVTFVRDVLTQLGREFLLNQVNENFVFGQYVGNSMKNLTTEVRLRMQHDILDLIVKYQRGGGNKGDTNTTSEVNDVRKREEDKLPQPYQRELKLEKRSNDTEDGWPDFSNLAKIVG